MPQSSTLAAFGGESFFLQQAWIFHEFLSRDRETANALVEDTAYGAVRE